MSGGRVLRVGIDLDEVVRDFVGSLNRWYAIDHPDHWIKEITEWNLAPFYPIGAGINEYAFEQRAKEILEGAEVCKGAIEMLEALKARGCEVWIINAPARRGHELFACNWLAEHKIPYNHLAFTVKKYRIDCHVYLDDGQHNLEALRDSGKFAVAWTKPWNKGWVGPRVSSYDRFLELIDGMRGVCLRPD